MAITFHVPNSALGGIDEYTKLMLHMDGADDGTTFTDDSASDHAFTLVASVVTKTATKKFGTASAYFDGVTYMHTPDHEDWNFGNGDFTIDFWYRPASLTAYDTWIGQTNIDSSNLWKFDMGPAGNRPRFTASVGGLIIADYTVTNAVTFTLGTWYHMAFERNGSTCKIYKDGISIPLTIGADISTDSMPDLNSRLTIGADDENLGRDCSGYIDEFRISKGIARWTTDFTPVGPYTT